MDVMFSMDASVLLSYLDIMIHYFREEEEELILYHSSEEPRVIVGLLIVLQWDGKPGGQIGFATPFGGSGQCMSLGRKLAAASSATSGETAGVEELILLPTFGKTTALLRD
ncbi:hypothetical protein Tco_1430618 [Tanacetum coccineum]